VLQRALRSRSFLLRGQERCKERRVVPCLTLERLFKREALLGVPIRRLRASESSGNQGWERGEEPSIPWSVTRRGGILRTAVKVARGLHSSNGVLKPRVPQTRVQRLKNRHSALGRK
jgi:hypothetical protein